jgi:hypothetical protein
MRSSQSKIDQPSLSSGKGRGPLSNLYTNVLLEFKETKNSRNYGKLWSNIAPSGNIYRYIGLRQERLFHCWDIRRQLEEVVEQKKELFGGEKSEAKCMEELLKALDETTAAGGVDSEEGEVSKGFLPLQEFGCDEVGRVGLIHFPLDSDELSRWRFNHFLAFLVFAIQTLGVGLLIIQLWYGKDNQLKDPRILWKNLNFKEMLCVGKDASTALTTIAGVMFLLLIYAIVYNYALDELENACKTGRLPTNKFWSGLGSFANAFCGCFVLLAIPMEFWSEDGIVGIMMNSMALLFVFTLDDLTCDAFGYLGTDDSDFAKELSWHYALLSFCPINLRDLIDDNATKLDELWKIKYASNGSLVSAQTGKVCRTRIMDVTPEPTEKSPLVQDEIEEGDMSSLVVEYCTGEFASTELLPGMRARLLKVLWTVILWAIKIMWVVVPIVWFIVNKPCTDA